MVYRYDNRRKKSYGKYVILGIVLGIILSVGGFYVYEDYKQNIGEYIKNITSEPSSKTIASQIHSLVNKERENYALNKLVWNEHIAEVAQSHSDDMLVTEDFSHNGLNQRLQDIGCITGSENIEVMRGYHLEQIPQVAINDWMNSYGHRENILNPRFSQEGIGINLEGSKVLITEEFC